MGIGKTAPYQYRKSAPIPCTPARLLASPPHFLASSASTILDHRQKLLQDEAESAQVGVRAVIIHACSRTDT